MSKLNGTIISYITSDGLRLKGYLARAKRPRATIIHIHGNFGNFYENEFVPEMAQRYVSARINFLCINNRGHDGIAEGYRNGKLTYVGAAYEEVRRFHYDIDGAVRYALRLSPRVILQGHSFGCVKVLAYLIKRNKPLEFILLSPSDPYRLQANYIKPEPIRRQLARIRSEYKSNLDTFLPPSEFGICQGPVRYHIPITAQTFISLFTSELVRVLRYDKPRKYFIDSKAFVYYGGGDALQTETQEQAKHFFKERTNELMFFYLKLGDHHFHGLERVVSRAIARWVRRESGSA
jgi:pimeloyl-ACP methyl ester carboxylesterase